MRQIIIINLWIWISTKFDMFVSKWSFLGKNVHNLLILKDLMGHERHTFRFFEDWEIAYKCKRVNALLICYK